MPLPTVLVTTTIRASKPGQSHGEAHLVDLERGTSRRVIDWNDPNIEWSGRGAGRGLRGVAFHDGDVYIASAEKLLVYTPEFRLKRAFPNRYLGDCHELFRDGTTLYAASTRFDCILAFDLAGGQFTRGWTFRFQWSADPRTTVDAVPRGVQASIFDPRKEGGPQAGDSTHLNHVWIEDGVMYASGVLLKSVLRFEESGPRDWAVVPQWTHNARPYRDGTLCNVCHSGADAILYLDRRGAVLKRFPVARYDEAALTNVPENPNVARQAFARGLVTTEDGLIIGGSSPTTVSVFEFESGRMLRSVNVTMNVRHAPHGLAVWPY